MDVGKLFLITGALLLIIGIVITLFGGISGIPRLPGDIFVKRGNFTFYFPLVTSILISIILSIILQFLFRK